MCSFSGCYFVKQNDKKNIINAYTSSESLCRYYTFKATLRNIREVSSNDYNNKFFEFNVDYDYFEKQYSDDDYKTADGVKRWESSYSEFNHYEFWVDPSNYHVLVQNGSYDLLVEGVEVIISANNYYGYAGWRYPILSLMIDGVNYLNFETGKENYLNYVKAGFKVT